VSNALEQRVRLLTEQLLQIRGELRRAEERIAALTTIDDATGLLNARTLHERALLEVERASRYDRPLGLVVLEPDDPGALRVLSEICRAQCRHVDLAGRDGRDIALFLPETALAGALVIADRICATARRQGVAVNAGCAAFPVHGRVLGRLLTAARQALARARAAGTSVRSVAMG
jgi:PleD family two-component response regulator